jgi:2-phospho-L-lactate guanylyltransferase
MAQALVPLKDLVQAKSRLAGLLRPSERRALAQAMVEDVLGVLARHSEIEQITLVSDDPGAGLLAQKYALQCWPEKSLGTQGLNALIQRASAQLLAGGGPPLLVLHGDLPLLTEEDISTVLASQRKLQGLIIGCDRQGTGTNLLAFDARSMPQFCFGVDSCNGHQASARRLGVPVQILQRMGIGVDVDDASDLQCAMSQLSLHPAGETAQLLHNTPLGARLKLALATLPGNASADGELNKGDVSKGKAS